MRYPADPSKNIFTPRARTPVGLGTALETLLKPVAAVIGKSGCGGCRRRAQKLNRMVPNINPLA